ncbi:hypothetical protein DFP72DRAFT_848605 [Ephemerocybe angulata]|uniref:Uncharacterized protein n=1 Tax=Ephemerocybe angulata TaxID=980116 RepID=A0A8H6M3B2_9AGAR|nr:hypothetical protein DFP72DRAFT_848605 [Tulosesus angulatus]
MYTHSLSVPVILLMATVSTAAPIVSNTLAVRQLRSINGGGWMNALVKGDIKASSFIGCGRPSSPANTSKAGQKSTPSAQRKIRPQNNKVNSNSSANSKRKHSPKSKHQRTRKLAQMSKHANNPKHTHKPKRIQRTEHNQKHQKSKDIKKQKAAKTRQGGKQRHKETQNPKRGN